MTDKSALVVDEAMVEKIKAFLRVRTGPWADDYPWTQLNNATDILRAIDTALQNAVGEQPAPKVVSGAVREALEKLPRRIEKISGQSFSYIKLEDALAVLALSQEPAPKEPHK